jgi:murein DD-endopeptidase MepM/ murein hydrolase activator NlpD
LLNFRVPKIPPPDLMQDKKKRILTQSLRAVPAAMHRIPRRYYWLAALVSAPFLGIVTAFGVATPLNDSVVPLRTVVEAIALPPAVEPETPAVPQQFWREERVQAGDTVAALLSRLGIDDTAAVEFLRVNREARSFHQLRPGRSVSAIIGDSGKLQSLRYAFSDNSQSVVERKDDGFRVTEQPLNLRPRTHMKSAEIKSSLFAATDAAGIPDNVAIQLAEIFGGDVDFHRDLRTGDRFTVVYEMLEGMAGETVRSGRVLAAEFINQNKVYRAVYFEDAARHGGYYGADGKNLRKAFLRSPLAFTRISSGFTSARFHPILLKWRAHKGIDYAAPIGTPVRATADGAVEFEGQKGGYGNVIVLHHQGKYSTLYGHLSRFAPGTRSGARVTQGEIIGYVGMTGWATGPHLHYEFRISEVQTNPLSVALPTALPLTGTALVQFHGAASPLLARLDLLRNSNLARLE